MSENESNNKSTSKKPNKNEENMGKIDATEATEDNVPAEKTHEVASTDSVVVENIDEPTSVKSEDTEKNASDTNHKKEEEALFDTGDTPLPKTDHAQTEPDRAPDSKGKAQVETVIRYATWPHLVLFVCLIAVVVGVGFITLQGQQLISKKDQEISQLKTEIAQQSASYQKDINSQSDKLRSEIKQIQKTTNSFKQDLSAAQQRLAAQGKRLRAMSDTSREDWLLAEAEYLLKLANQRVRIERSPQGADALITEADTILRELDQPDLHDIRREISEDLAALRLMKKVDVEGIYLQLVALSQSVEKLPHRQPPQDRLMPEYSEIENTGELSLTEKLSSSWSRLVAEIKSHVKVSKHNVEVKPVLAAQDAFYLQQNLRLILERSQLALLREQQEIYAQSVNQAKEWIEKYYPESSEANAFVTQLNELSTKTVTQNLPNISDSLNALHEYIEALHDLKGVASPPSKKNAES